MGMEAEAAVEVIIVGAGPAGLATSTCLNLRNVSNIVLEKDDCSGSLWKKRSYNRLKLHLAKEFCQLPHMPFPKETPRYVPRDSFIQYLDDYVSHFGIAPRYQRMVESASFDVEAGKWCVVVKNTRWDVEEVYYGEFLVVATGENSEGFVPRLKGLESFEGVLMHSSLFKNGEEFDGKDVLVVGSGNSGMEIAYDLSNNWNANASICVRSPVHVLTKEIVFIGMVMLKFLPLKLVDKMTTTLGRLKHGNISKFGIEKPKHGPFYLKAKTGQSPTIDVGCIDKVKTGDIRVFPAVSSIEGDKIKFDNGKIKHFDVIIFATGYRSTVKKWLKDKEEFFDDIGMPKAKFPKHWKGKNGLYCAGFASRGLLGISDDAENIAKDIYLILNLKMNQVLNN